MLSWDPPEPPDYHCPCCGCVVNEYIYIEDGKVIGCENCRAINKYDIVEDGYEIMRALGYEDY